MYYWVVQKSFVIKNERKVKGIPNLFIGSWYSAVSIVASIQDG
jgi:hypothetical protein